MIDRGKVIKGLECCRSIDDNCEKCPYNYEGEHGENECLRGQLMPDILALLKEQPQIVLCKDCRYWQDNNGGYPHSDCRWGHDETPDADDYCSFGEPKGGDGE